MKTSLILFLLAFECTRGFILPGHQAQFGLPSTSLKNSRTSSAEAIEAALEASKKFGSTSPEARVAWDIVEELDASDNSAAYSGGVTEEECVYDSSSKECEEYFSKITALSTLLEEQKASIEAVKSLANEIRGIKVANPQVSIPFQDTSAMRAALQNAKDAVEKYGDSSSEAKLAWETVEEIASNDFGEATKKSLDDECLIESIEACEAIEELQRAVFLEQRKESGRYQG